jgi:Holliday junction resolvase RusA-like endonuclease
VIAFTVYGVPVPQGSTKAFVPKGWKRPIITHDSARTKPWRQAIVDAALAQLDGHPPIEDPVRLTVRFYLPRPKSAPRRVVWPAKLPDLDKLVRAVCDALTAAGVWRDDAQVVSLTASKAFAGGVADAGVHGVPRAMIEVA